MKCSMNSMHREISAGAEATVAKVRDVASATAEQSQAGTSVAQSSGAVGAASSASAPAGAGTAGTAGT